MSKDSIYVPGIHQDVNIITTKGLYAKIILDYNLCETTDCTDCFKDKIENLKHTSRKYSNDTFIFTGLMPNSTYNILRYTNKEGKVEFLFIYVKEGKVPKLIRQINNLDVSMKELGFREESDKTMETDFDKIFKSLSERLKDFVVAVAKSYIESKVEKIKDFGGKVILTNNFLIMWCDKLERVEQYENNLDDSESCYHVNFRYSSVVILFSNLVVCGINDGHPVISNSEIGCFLERDKIDSLVKGLCSNSNSKIEGFSYEDYLKLINI